MFVNGNREEPCNQECRRKSSWPTFSLVRSVGGSRMFDDEAFLSPIYGIIQRCYHLFPSGRRVNLKLYTPSRMHCSDQPDQTYNECEKHSWSVYYSWSTCPVDSVIKLLNTVFWYTESPLYVFVSVLHVSWPLWLHVWGKDELCHAVSYFVLASCLSTWCRNPLTGVNILGNWEHNHFNQDEAPGLWVTKATCNQNVFICALKIFPCGL